MHKTGALESAPLYRWALYFVRVVNFEMTSALLLWAASVLKVFHLIETFPLEDAATRLNLL